MEDLNLENKLSIYNYTVKELENILINDGMKRYQASQIYDWIYRKGVKDFSLMTNIGKKNETYFKNKFQINALKIKKKQESSDETRKYLFELEDGNYIETVLMKQDYGYSVCVSSQVGCNMGCAFCASGLHKKVRNLETYELVLQVSTINEELRKVNERVSHVVIMGIGEPFDNYDNVLRFIEIINYPLGLEIGARHITLSTSGIVPKILEFASFDIHVNLAVSLHFPNDELRSKYMKVNRAYNLTELMNALNTYYSITKRRLTFEYILIDGVNDQVCHAYELIDLIRGMNAYVNLIPMNETTGLLKRSSEKNINRFFDILQKNNIQCTIRREQGHDIDAACGQLRIKTMQNKE